MSTEDRSMTDNPNPGLRRTDLRTAKVRILKYADMQKCPHYIIEPDHYRADGSCLCDDPNAKVMAEWGYKWDATSKQWKS